MSELARRLIDAAQADCASRLAAIEAHAALIEEAETLAATLRSAGIADAKAHGSSFCDSVARRGCIDAWVDSGNCDALALQWALRDAGLNVIGIDARRQAGFLRVDGIGCLLRVPIDVECYFAAILPTLIKEDRAHA